MFTFLLIGIVGFLVVALFSSLVISSRKEAEAEYTYKEYLKEQEKKDAGKDSRK